MIESISQVVSQHGVNAGVLVLLASAVAAYVYRDWSRIQKLESRLEALETEVREKLGGVLLRMDKALRESTEQVTVSKKIIEKFLLQK